jgi:hypothetical protein
LTNSIYIRKLRPKLFHKIDSSGSDSGFYPTGKEERRNTVRRNLAGKKSAGQPPEASPRCSRCSIHSDGSSLDEAKECDAHQNYLNERGRPSRGVTRRHSRASSVDRREIFTKYVARASEHSVAIHPFASHDPGSLLVKKRFCQPSQNCINLCHSKFRFFIRVARWFLFKPKIPIWVNFGGP